MRVAPSTCIDYQKNLPFFLLQEVLVQLEKEERLEKLEETFQIVREDYIRILSMIR
jgi:hypothetical protein